MATLQVKDVHIAVDGSEIVKGLSLTVKQGEVHAIMGPNGSGKSTLASAIAGHPKYNVTSGDILLGGKSLLKLAPDERARMGLFLAFQYPPEIPGLKLSSFLRAAAKDEFKKLDEHMKLIGINPQFKTRGLNEGFSGGEKKRIEMLQLAMLKPKIAILDEADSGLDIDSVKLAANAVNRMKGMGVLVITHYQRILKYIRPDYIHVMIDGKIVKSGTGSLAGQLEKKGYDWLR